MAQVGVLDNGPGHWRGGKVADNMSSGILQKACPEVHIQRGSLRQEFEAIQLVTMASFTSGCQAYPGYDHVRRSVQTETETNRAGAKLMAQGVGCLVRIFEHFQYSDAFWRHVQEEWCCVVIR
ncbi:hypothetical protein ACHAPT_012139, partial [Fusarium lateritium]